MVDAIVGGERFVITSFSLIETSYFLPHALTFYTEQYHLVNVTKFNDTTILGRVCEGSYDNKK